jgi:hypothetical protein
LPEIKYSMVKLDVLKGLAPQFVEFLWDTDPTQFKRSLHENCGKGQFFHHLITEKLNDEHFCYLKPDKVTGERDFSADRTALAEVIHSYLWENSHKMLGEICCFVW